MVLFCIIHYLEGIYKTVLRFLVFGFSHVTSQINHIQLKIRWNHTVKWILKHGRFFVFFLLLYFYQGPQTDETIVWAQNICLWNPWMGMKILLVAVTCNNKGSVLSSILWFNELLSKNFITEVLNVSRSSECKGCFPL